jgi:hypothetical protein
MKGALVMPEQLVELGAGLDEIRVHVGEKDGVDRQHMGLGPTLNLEDDDDVEDRTPGSRVRDANLADGDLHADFSSTTRTAYWQRRMAPWRRVRPGEVTAAKVVASIRLIGGMTARSTSRSPRVGLPANGK